MSLVKYLEGILSCQVRKQNRLALTAELEAYYIYLLKGSCLKYNMDKTNLLKLSYFSFYVVKFTIGIYIYVYIIINVKKVFTV